MLLFKNPSSNVLSCRLAVFLKKEGKKEFHNMCRTVKVFFPRDKEYEDTQSSAGLNPCAPQNYSTSFI